MAKLAEMADMAEMFEKTYMDEDAKFAELLKLLIKFKLLYYSVLTQFI